VYTDGNRAQEWKSRTIAGLRAAIRLLRRGGNAAARAAARFDHAVFQELPYMIGPCPSSNAQGGVG
jgi:hypothetical protein